MPVSARVVRPLLACAVLALLPVQLFVFADQPFEPYPALTQPGFLGTGPLHDGIVRRDALTITAVTTAGTIIVITPKELVPDTGGIDERAIIASTFRDPALASSDDVVEWVRTRLELLLPDQQIATLTVSSQRVLNPVASPARVKVEKVLWETTIRLGDSG